MAQQLISLGTTPNDGTGTNLRTAGGYINSMFTEIYGKVINDNFVIVKTVADFPAAVSTVRTLLDDTTYFVTGDIDLTGDRLVLGLGTVLVGTSSTNATISSTGLTVNPLIYSEYSVNIRDISFDHAGYMCQLEGNGTTDNAFINSTSFSNATQFTIRDYNSCIINSCSLLNVADFEFDGTLGTLSFENCLFTVATGGTGIHILSTCIITRRFRATFSSFIVPSTSIGIDFDVSATIPDEAYILLGVNFSGSGTYLSGVQFSDNKAFFANCVGITNTSVTGQAYMQSNATATVIGAINVYNKVLGTTTAGPDNERYLHSDNRLTCDATIQRKYLIQCTLTFTSGNNQVCRFGFYDSELGSVRTASQIRTTTSGAGVAENITFNDIVQHGNGEYIEVHCMNTTSATNITVTEMNLMVTEIR